MNIDRLCLRIEHRHLSRLAYDQSRRSLVGYVSELIRFPTQHLSVIILSNSSDVKPGDLALKVADLYLQK